MLDENSSEILDINELDIIVEKMIDLSIKENFCLKKMDIENLSKLADEKLVLLFLMTKMKNLIQTNYELKEKFSEKEKNKIKEKYKILENSMNENLDLAGYATCFNRKMLELLEEKFFRKGNKLNIYNNRGGAIK